MSIVTKPDYWSSETVTKLEEHYSARYVCELPLKESSGWREDPSLIFYTDTPHPQGSNYFAISRSGDDIVISDARQSVGYPIRGVRATNGDIIYSHCRHHYNVSSDKSVWIDGGMDYLRTANGGDRLVYLKIDGDRLVEAFTETKDGSTSEQE